MRNQVFIVCSSELGILNLCVDIDRPIASYDDVLLIEEVIVKELRKKFPEEKIENVVLMNWRRFELQGGKNGAN